MLRRLFGSLAIMVVLAAGVNAQSVNIDTYNEGAGGNSFSFTATQALPSVSQLHTGLTTAIGGQRLARAHFVTGGSGDTVGINNTATSGVFAANLSASATLTGHFHLYYGYDAFNTAQPNPIDPSHTFFDLNTNVSGALGANWALEFNVVAMDHNATYIVRLVSDRLGTPVVASVSESRLAGFSGIISIPSSAFVGINGSDIDQIILETSDLSESTDLRIDNLQFVSVPEPTTYALAIGSLAVLGGGIWHRRRKSARAANALVINEE